MQLSDRELRNFVRVIMPELYRWQAAWDEWTDAAARLCMNKVTSQDTATETPDDRSENVH